MRDSFLQRNIVSASMLVLVGALSASSGVVLAKPDDGLSREEFVAQCQKWGFIVPGDATLEAPTLAALATVDDVRTLCRQLHRGQTVGSDGLAAFQAADRNGDLVLSPEEASFLPVQFKDAAVDRDGNGAISLAEYRSTALSVGSTTVNAVVAVGSRLRGNTEAQALPVEVVGRENFEARGNPSTSSVIRDLSEVGNVQGQSARGTNAGGYGVSSINLRNLGSGREVITMNGRRLADDPNTNGGGANVTGGGQQNANSVPIEVLTQMEILKDGGGATYGADAVGGVVNFVAAPAAAPPAPNYLPPAAYQTPGTERYPERRVNAVKEVSAEPVSTFSIDVDTASYSNVRRYLRDGQRPPVDAVRIEEMINYFDYGYERPTSTQEPFRPFVAVAPSPWAEGRQLMHIGVQGYLPPAAERPPLNLVFLVDTSGSMSSADRLPLAQQTLNLLIDQLRPGDRVSMVAYAGSAGVVLRPTKGTDKLRMRLAVESLQSGGSTAGGAGLTLAYALAQENFDTKAINRVVLMTDGDFNVGTTDNKTLEQYIADKRESGVYLSVFGYGRGNYQDARMQTLAQNGNGTAAYIDGLDEARRLVRDQFDASMVTIADDVKIQVEFNPAVIAEYRLIGYETRMLRRQDFNNDAVDAGEVGAGVSVTALYEVTPVGGPVANTPLRFGPQQPVRGGASGADMAFLQIRYKLPGGDSSVLMQRPIGPANSYATLQAAPEATRWAAAVAAYGQKLRRDNYVSGSFSWQDTLDLAQSARGEDEFGHRAEFIQLIRAARELTQLNAGL